MASLPNGDANPVHGRVNVNPWELIPSHRLGKSPREMEALKQSIQNRGFVHNLDEPVAFVVVNGKKHIVDGHHRVRAAQELGLTEIPAVEVQLPYQGYHSAEDLFDWDR